MTGPKRKFLANLVSDLGKLLIGAGAISQAFAAVPDWVKVNVVLIISLTLFIFAFFIHPNHED